MQSLGGFCSALLDGLFGALCGSLTPDCCCLGRYSLGPFVMYYIIVMGFSFVCTHTHILINRFSGLERGMSPDL